MVGFYIDDSADAQRKTVFSVAGQARNPTKSLWIKTARIIGWGTLVLGTMTVLFAAPYIRIDADRVGWRRDAKRMSEVECSCSELPFRADRSEGGTPRHVNAGERTQWVEATQKLEISPLDDSVNKQGEWALKRVSDAHDIHVPLCPGLLSGFNGMKYTYAHAITRQYMLASTAFLIENPEKASAVDAMNLAAVESVLKTYSAILQQKPEAKSKTLDDLLKKQSQGKLKDFVQKQCH